MRVTHVITRLIIGGAQENTVATVLGLQGRPDLEVNLISGPTTGLEGSLEPLLKPELLARVPDLIRPVNPWKDAQAYRKLVQIFRAQPPQIVHTHSGKAGFLGRLAAHRARVPIIVHTIHGPSFGPFQGAAPNMMFKNAERLAGRVTTHFASVANAMTQQYLAAGIGYPAQYSRIFSGFALAPFLEAQNDPSLRARLHLQPGGIVIGNISRLFKLKGQDDLLSIAPALLKRHPALKFLLVGGGAWRGRLQERARSLGLEKQVIFTGLVPPDEIPRYLGVMDILAHLSRREGLARALPQAMAAGRPVVAYDCDGANEVCLPGETGFLVQPGDLHSLEECLAQLVADRQLRERLGKTGREFVRTRFSVETMVENIYTLYRKLAGGGKR